MTASMLTESKNTEKIKEINCDVSVNAVKIHIIQLFGALRTALNSK